MKYPSTVDINVYKAYMGGTSSRRYHGINAMDLHWETVETLRDICIRTIAEHWATYPIFEAIEFPEDRRQLLDSMDVSNPNLRLTDLCAFVKDDDAFWKRCFMCRWPNFVLSGAKGKKWIQIYLEKHLAENLEMLKPSEYNRDNIQQLIELCSPYVQELKVNQLQPGSNERGDHIPLDFVITNLAELKTIEITYDTKSVGKHYVLGCSNITDMDIRTLVYGLARCYELQEFHLHSTKLEPEMLRLIARALDRHPQLHTLSLIHCRCGDSGLAGFVDSITPESFPALKTLDLTNNFLAPEGALELAEILNKRNIEKLDMRLNPITSEGAAAIFAAVALIPLKELNLACCSLDETIGPLLIHLIQTNKTIKSLNISANRLGQKIGENILRVIKSNTVIQELDIRNSDISYEIKSAIDSIILENRDRTQFKWS